MGRAQVRYQRWNAYGMFHTECELTVVVNANRECEINIRYTIQIDVEFIACKYLTGSRIR